MTFEEMMLISCWEKYRSHQCNVLHCQVSGPMPLVVLSIAPAVPAGRGHLEVDKVGDRVPSQRTQCLLFFSPAGKL